MPQRAVAVDGVEWDAADMSFDQDGRDTDFLRRTVLGMGQAGVAAGGVVTDAGTRHIAISGPLQFTVNGELDVISAPANVLLGASDTWFIIAKHGLTDDTPATYYGAGTPPFKHRHPAPTIVVRNAGGGGAAVTIDDEVDLATVTTNSTVVTSITDTRIVVPTVTAGDINLGSLNTIDGVDPSAHVADIGDASHAAHLKLGAVGGAARYALECPYYIVDMYSHSFGTSYVVNESDFTSPPGGVTVTTFRLETKFGTFWREGYSPLWIVRATLHFNSTASFSAVGSLLAIDDTVRVKLNGSDLYTHNATNYSLNASVSLPVVAGSNTLQLYFNNGLDQYTFQFLTDLLNDSRITFDPQ